MSMFLVKVPTETIRLVGRWMSDAFLRYLRPRVLQFTTGVAADMNRHPNFVAAVQATANPEQDQFNNT